MHLLNQFYGILKKKTHTQIFSLYFKRFIKKDTKLKFSSTIKNQK